MIHDQVIFQKSVIRIQLFSILGYIFQSDQRQYSEFLIIGLLYYAQCYRGFFILSILAYSRRAIKYKVQLEVYCKAVLSGQYYSASFKDLYSRKCKRCLYSDYCLVDLRALPAVIHILIGIIPVPVLSVFIYPLSKFQGRNFCMVDGM